MSLKHLNKITIFAFGIGCFSPSLISAPGGAPAGGLLPTVAITPLRDMGVVTGDASSKFRTYFSPTQEVPLAAANAKLFVGSMVNVDYYFLRHAETLDDANKDDAESQFRQRTELSFLLKYGTQNDQERGVVETRISVANTLFMRSIYKVSDYNNSNDPSGSAFDQNFSPIKTQFEQAWLQVNFDRLVPRMEKRPHFLRIGYFPYLVGRGISLGDWAQGGVDYMGFKKDGEQTYAPMYPPGFLWRGEITKYSSYDIYFSPLVTEDIVGANKPDAVVIRLPNESFLSRHIASVSATIGGEFKDLSDKMAIKEGMAMANPYWVYYNSPRQTVDIAADSPTSLHTFGCMAEISTGGFEINFEVAKQFGRQTVREVVNKDLPSVNHFDPITGRFRPLPAAVFAQLPAGSVNPDRWFAGDDYTGGPGNYWENMDPAARLAEYRPSYDISLEGWMALFDARYQFKDYPVIVAVAGGYFSGDCYPYNDNIDKYFASSGTDLYSLASDGQTVNINPEPEHHYRGFLPLRDREYFGLWAHPLVMVNAGIVPRPKQLGLQELSAVNDDDTLTNLAYIGTGIALRPLQDREKLRLNANLFTYWNDESLKKWDKKATPPVRLVQNEGVVLGGINKYDALQIQGWLSDESASRFFGWEINTVIAYKIAYNLDLSLRGGIFFPGKLYTDLSGQPNDNTLVEKLELSPTAPGAINTITSFKGLGEDKAYGFYLRLRYVF
jgi:hypothetical protein